jgi:hypothetical protein
MCGKKGHLYTKAKKGKIHWEEFIYFQKSTQKALKKAYWQYVNCMLNQGMEEGNQTPFWRYISIQAKTTKVSLCFLEVVVFIRTHSRKRKSSVNGSRPYLPLMIGRLETPILNVCIIPNA